MTSDDDNEEQVDNDELASQLLEESGPMISQHDTCFAHTLQLVVRDVNWR